MGMDGARWFGEPANILIRNSWQTYGFNHGLMNDFIWETGALIGADQEARMPTDQAENLRYKETNDITVTDNGDGTATIASAANGFDVYSESNKRGFKVGDYVYVHGSTSSYPITAIESDGSEMTVSGTLNAYTPTAYEYAAVYRVGRRPV
jgi:hypothetical protein